ncbi:S-adenosyl-L-methionine-dependent methyltransferase [Aspergillus steynii IBT 23096]|uniref:Sterol 24-C-methyltransferase n=1 Tax=Aspergillus steynii IBT 23096 TaxID=1392250 RepID=A0A2I2GGR6_9EURO|nr:S-adenosyl-L-methionine-dependent methyltransferase [Aspergillus steynii IBT 23096]PLB52027.1 S-adenosyl-L-methionine-dependent methyltransferase [Aspergillus steynii IBT 23096]
MDKIWGTSFHVCRQVPGESFRAAMTRHEHYLALRLGLKPGQRVLDVGCGIGGPAREIARFAEVEVCGIDSCLAHIQRAQALTEPSNLSPGQARFLVRNFTATNLPQGSFDRAYAIEATCYAPDLTAVYGEAFRVLKPGGVFAVYEVALTERYDDQCAEHREILHRMESVAGNPHLKPTVEVMAAMKAVGFELLSAEDLADAPGSFPWYRLIDGSFKRMGGFGETLAGGCLAAFYKTFSSRWGRDLLKYGEMVGILANGRQGHVEEMIQVMQAYCIAGEEKLVTPMFLMVGRKPEV